MSEPTSSPTTPVGRPVEVTYTTTHKTTVHVKDDDFLDDLIDLGPVARANAFSEARFGPKMTGYIDRHRDLFPGIPSDAEIVYVDPQSDRK